MARMVEEEYRFYQQKIDDSLEKVAAHADEFAVLAKASREDVLSFFGKELSERALKDMTKIVGVPKKLLLESSRPTLLMLLEERFRLLGIENLQITSFDDVIVSVLREDSAYISPQRYLGEGGNHVVWADLMGQDVVRIWRPQDTFEIGDEKFGFGSRLLVGTTTKRHVVAEPRVEKTVCENGMMRLVAAKAVNKIEVSQPDEVIRQFLAVMAEDAAAFAEDVRVSLEEAAAVEVPEADVLVQSMLEQGGLTPRAKKKVFLKTLEYLNPESEINRKEAGIKGEMATADDFFQLATNVAKQYSDNARESLEKKVTNLLTTVFLAKPETRKAPWRVA